MVLDSANVPVDSSDAQPAGRNTALALTDEDPGEPGLAAAHQPSRQIAAPCQAAGWVPTPAWARRPSETTQTAFGMMPSPVRTVASGDGRCPCLWVTGLCPPPRPGLSTEAAAVLCPRSKGSEAWGGEGGRGLAGGSIRCGQGCSCDGAAVGRAQRKSPWCGRGGSHVPDRDIPRAPSSWQ